MGEIRQRRRDAVAVFARKDDERIGRHDLSAEPRQDFPRVARLEFFVHLVEERELTMLSKFTGQETCQSKITNVCRHSLQHGRLTAVGETGHEQFCEPELWGG